MSQTHLTYYPTEFQKDSAYLSPMFILYHHDQKLFIMDRKNFELRYQFVFSSESVWHISMQNFDLCVGIEEGLMFADVRSLHAGGEVIEECKTKRVLPISKHEAQVCFHGIRFIGVHVHDRIQIFDVKTLEKKNELKYRSDLLCSITSDDLIIANGFAKGSVHQHFLNGTQFPSELSCHKGSISQISVHENWLATASESGKIIRLWNLAEQKKGPVKEFRRAHWWSFNEKILSVEFNDDGTLLSVLSSTKTLHIYKVQEIIKYSDTDSTTMMQSLYGEEWSFVRVSLAQFISNEAMEKPFFCYFNGDNFVNIILHEDFGATLLEIEFQFIGRNPSAKRIRRLNLPGHVLIPNCLCLELIENDKERHRCVVPDSQNTTFAQLRLMIQNSFRIQSIDSIKLYCKKDHKRLKMDWIVPILHTDYHQKKNGFFEIVLKTKP